MIRQDREGAVGLVTLNRPERLNALSAALVGRLEETLVALDGDEAVRAIVLTGAPPSFCAGSDLKEMSQCDEPTLADLHRRAGALARRLGLLETPVLAAVEGHAFGGGFILATSCDLVVSAEDAIWNLAEVPSGFLPPWGLSTLAARVGPVTARRLTWGHERLDGCAARELGIADYTSASGEAQTTALELAERIAALPQASARATKAFFRSLVLADAETHDAAALAAFVENCRHPEAQEVFARFGGGGNNNG